MIVRKNLRINTKIFWVKQELFDIDVALLLFYKAML